MDIDELRSVRRTERGKDSLQHLRDSFYEDVAAYLEDRKAERQRAAAAADDPFGDPDVGRLTDEISTAEDVVEAIYERRVGKVVKLASFAAADMSADKSGLTAEERALFDDLVERIKRNRRTVLDTLAGEGDTTTANPDTTAEDPATAEPAPPAPASDDNGAGREVADERNPPAAADAGTPAAADDRTSEADAVTAPTGTESAEPPTPDDVLAAAMGGSDADGSTSAPDAAAGNASDTGTSTAADAAAPTGTEPESVPPATEGDDRERDVPVVDNAETDGGDARVADHSGSTAEAAGRTSTAPDAGTAAETADADGPRPDRVTLRITENVGRIYGVDEREYDLAAEDVVTLPATNAGPLVERDAAERLE
jgi:DNA replication factor GINS